MVNTLITDLYDLYRGKLLIAYQGDFDKALLTAIAKNLEKIAPHDTEIARRFFKIFIELTHNISCYSDENSDNEYREGAGIFVVMNQPEHFSFITGNYTNEENLQNLQKTIELINTKDRDSLREFKRKQLSKPNNKKRSIGLVNSALISGESIRFNVKRMDSNSAFVTVCISIKK